MNSTIIQAALWLLSVLAAVGTYYCFRPRRRVARVEERAGATFCPNCGKQIVLGSQFCAACGNRTSDTSQTGTQSVSAVAPKRRVGALRLIGGVCGVLLFILFGSAALFVSSGPSTSKIWTDTNAQLAAAAASSTGTAPHSDSGTAAAATGLDSERYLSRLKSGEYGGYDPRAFFELPEIQTALGKLFQGDRLFQFTYSLGAPEDGFPKAVDNAVVVAGCTPHACGSSQALLTFDLVTKTISAAQFEEQADNDSRITLYGVPSLEAAPAVMQEWVRTRKSDRPITVQVAN